MKKLFAGIMASLFIIAGLLGTGSLAYADTTEIGTYGGGDYGSCGYGSCTITLTSGGSVDVDVTPSGAGKCTVQSDTVSVETGNSAGYTLTMTTNAASNAMTGTNGTVPAHSGTAASPSILTMNVWGYRVDGTAGFGAGPTSGQSSGSVPSGTFAGVPPNTQGGTAVASSNVAVSPAEDTAVWYGACANTTQPSGSYATTILYTAVAN